MEDYVECESYIVRAPWADYKGVHTWLGGQVASPRDKVGYPRITINPKLTISGVA